MHRWLTTTRVQNLVTEVVLSGLIYTEKIGSIEKGQHQYMLNSVIFVILNENSDHFGGATGTRFLCEEILSLAIFLTFHLALS
jgi:hypothetical protein